VTPSLLLYSPSRKTDPFSFPAILRWLQAPSQKVEGAVDPTNLHFRKADPVIFPAVLGVPQPREGVLSDNAANAGKVRVNRVSLYYRRNTPPHD